MKIAVSAVSEDLEQEVNPVFGRCSGFLIIEIEGKEIKEHKFIENQAIKNPMGAGIAAAQTVASQKVQAVISGNIGPNALMVLNQSGIKVYQAFELNVKQAIEQLAKGKLQEISVASASNHFGMESNKGPEVKGDTDKWAGTKRGFGKGKNQPM